jgi:hypothetical protein
MVIKMSQYEKYRKGKYVNINIATFNAMTVDEKLDYLEAHKIDLTGILSHASQTQNYKRKHPELYPEQPQQEDESDDTESELDVTMTDGEDDLFPTDLED